MNKCKCKCDSVWILEPWCHIDAIMRCINLGKTNSAFTLQRRESLAIARLPTVHHARGHFKQIHVECSSLKSLLYLSWAEMQTLHKVE